MDLSHPSATVPLTPQEIKARLHTDRLAHASHTWDDVCVKCGATFSAGSGPRVHCFGCWPALSRAPQPVAHLPRSRVKRMRICAEARGVVAGRAQECQRCAYKLFVEVCHIRPVWSFPPTALVREVNAPENLILLCPNCHHELDAGLWTVDGREGAGSQVPPPSRHIPKQRASWCHSPYRGVHWDKVQQKWRVAIFSAGKTHNVGRFPDEREAALAYNAAALRLHGERAILNDVE